MENNARTPGAPVGRESYSNGFFLYESPQQRAQRRLEAKIQRSRTRLGFIMAMAHGAVELTLRNEPPRVRRAVSSDLSRRYGALRV